MAGDCRFMRVDAFARKAIADVKAGGSGVKIMHGQVTL